MYPFDEFYVLIERSFDKFPRFLHYSEPLRILVTFALTAYASKDMLTAAVIFVVLCIDLAFLTGCLLASYFAVYEISAHYVLATYNVAVSRVDCNVRRLILSAACSG